MIFADRVDELVAREDIIAVIDQFCRGVDRCDWELVRSAYHDDGYDRHGHFEGNPDDFVAYLAERHRHIDHSMHLRGTITVEFESRTRAFTETYLLSIQRHVAGSPKVGPGVAAVRTMTSARYVDEFERRAGTGWRILNRTVVWGDVASEEVQEPVAAPDLAIHARRDSEDPWYVIRNGRPIGAR